MPDRRSPVEMNDVAASLNLTGLLKIVAVLGHVR
jgi:hypothetical protein